MGYPLPEHGAQGSVPSVHEQVPATAVALVSQLVSSAAACPVVAWEADVRGCGASLTSTRRTSGTALQVRLGNRNVRLKSPPLRKPAPGLLFSVPKGICGRRSQVPRAGARPDLEWCGARMSG